jgi:hypothetical protein
LPQTSSCSRLWSRAARAWGCWRWFQPVLVEADDLGLMSSSMSCAVAPASDIEQQTTLYKRINVHRVHMDAVYRSLRTSRERLVVELQRSGRLLRDAELPVARRGGASLADAFRFRSYSEQNFEHVEVTDFLQRATPRRVGCLSTLYRAARASVCANDGTRMNWFLIPASPENIDRSLRNPVALAEIRQFLGEAESKRLAALGDGEIRCWAMTEGTKAQFAKMAPGDYVLFSEKGTGKFNYFAEVTAKVTNKGLGDHLWPVQPRATAKSNKVSSWELIYFLKNIRSIEAKKSTLVVLLRHDPKDAVAASRQLDNEKLAGFEAEHGPLLGWLHTNAKLDFQTQPAQAAVTEQPETVVALSPEPTIGIEYVPAKTTGTYQVSDQSYTYNTEEVERGRKGHIDTQEALAKFLRTKGLVPRSPAAHEPNFDVAWVVGETVFVAEVKSTTPDNEEHQLRLGLGQVLQYWHLMPGDGRRVVAVLVPETEPSKQDWIKLCEKLGVHIGWPGAFERVLGPTTGGGRGPE